MKKSTLLDMKTWYMTELEIANQAESWENWLSFWEKQTPT